MSNATNTTTAATSGAAELIREMQENVAKYGGENTATFLMVQAIEKLQRMSTALAAPAQAAPASIITASVMRDDDSDAVVDAAIDAARAAQGGAA